MSKGLRVALNPRQWGWMMSTQDRAGALAEEWHLKWCPWIAPSREVECHHNREPVAREIAALLDLLVEAKGSVEKHRHWVDSDREYARLQALIEKIEKVVGE